MSVDAAYLEMMSLVPVRPHIDAGKDDRILEHRHVAIDVVLPLPLSDTVKPVLRCTDRKTVSTGGHLHWDGRYSLESVSSSALRQLSLNLCAAVRWIHVSASKGVSILVIAGTETIKPSRPDEAVENGMPNRASTLETTHLQCRRMKGPQHTPSLFARFSSLSSLLFSFSTVCKRYGFSRLGRLPKRLSSSQS